MRLVVVTKIQRCRSPMDRLSGVQRFKDELLTTTAHELRTPVTTIRGLTQVLLRGLEQGNIPSQEALSKRLQVIQRETDRLAWGQI